jgi:hypothetical protein
MEAHGAILVLCVRSLVCLLAGAGCAGEPDARSTEVLGPALEVDVPEPQPQDGLSLSTLVAPHPRRLAFFDVEVGDDLGLVSARLDRTPTRLDRSTFEAVYRAAAYRDLGADVALALGFDSVAIFTDHDGAMFRSYVDSDRIRMMSFVASTMTEHGYSVRLSWGCRIGHVVETIESLCGTGFVTIDNSDAGYPTAYHYFSRGFSVVVTGDRITELHLYGGLMHDEITRVEAALRADSP